MMLSMQSTIRYRQAFESLDNLRLDYEMSEGQPAEMNWPDQSQFMAELNKEIANGSDRAIVLVCAAMVDELLRRLLTVALPHTSDDLFEGSGAVWGRSRQG